MPLLKKIGSGSKKGLDQDGYSKELQFPRIMQFGQPFQNEAAIQTGQNPHGQEEVLAAGDPLCTICRQAPARDNHVNVRMMPGLRIQIILAGIAALCGDI